MARAPAKAATPAAAKTEKPVPMAPSKPAKKTFTFPKTLGACADRIFTLREERKAAQKIVDAIEAEEKALKEHIIQTLPKSQASGVSGKLANVKTITKNVAHVEDWDKFYAHVKKTGSFDLMQKRLSDTAIQERWEGKKVVPGVVPFPVVTISVTKV